MFVFYSAFVQTQGRFTISKQINMTAGRKTKQIQSEIRETRKENICFKVGFEIL